MTPIASRPHVVEIESQVGPVGNWNLMVGVQMPFATVVSAAEFGEHHTGGHVPQFEALSVSNDCWFPAAINTPPAVPQEAHQPYPAMVSIVSALSTGATAHVMFTLACDPVGLACSVRR